MEISIWPSRVGSRVLSDFAGISLHFELCGEVSYCGSFFGKGFVGTFLWHLLLQNLNTRASFRTNVMPTFNQK